MGKIWGAGTVGLLIIAGASAAPQVALVDPGGLFKYAGDASAEVETVSASELGAWVAAAAGGAGVPAVTRSALPQIDLLQRPKSTQLVVVTGNLATILGGAEEGSPLREAFTGPRRYELAEEDGAWFTISDALRDVAGATCDVGPSAVRPSALVGTPCAAPAGSALAASDVLDAAVATSPLLSTLTAAGGTLSRLPGASVAWTVHLAGHERSAAAPVTLRLANADDRRALSSLLALAAGGEAALRVSVVDGLDRIAARGVREAAVARALLSAALEAAGASVAGPSVTALLAVQALRAPAQAAIARQQAADAAEVVAEAGRRRLASTDDAGTTDDYNLGNSTITADDIEQYNIVLWSSVGLCAIVLSAVLALAFLDPGRDSLLYATFQADVSGAKTD